MSFSHKANEADKSSNHVAQPRYLYLHGFASSPASRKAVFFAEKLAAEGITLVIPALDAGDFESLTISRQLDVVARAAGDAELVLIGSSMGGYLAGLFASRSSQVRRLCLLAPAFGFLDLWQKRLGEEDMERWQSTGTKLVFHYGLGRETQLSFDLLADARKYESQPHFDAPTLIFHGDQDNVVPVDSSLRYAAQNANARLIRLQAGHELTDDLENIWQQAKPFLLDSAAAN